MVTAICPIESTPMVVSADDGGIVKGFKNNSIIWI